MASVQARPGTLLSLHRALRRAHKGGAVLRLGAPAVLAAVVLEAHGHVSSLIPVRAAVLAAALRDRALLGELPPIVSVRAEQNGVRKRPWPGASCGGCLNEGTRGPMGRKSGHGVVFMTHHRRQPGRSRTHERRRTALTLRKGCVGIAERIRFISVRPLDLASWSALACMLTGSKSVSIEKRLVEHVLAQT